MKSSKPEPLTAQDFLFPTRLLERSHIEENPLVMHSKRRGDRFGRRISTLFFGLGLLLSAGYILTVTHKTFETNPYEARLGEAPLFNATTVYPFGDSNLFQWRIQIFYKYRPGYVRIQLPQSHAPMAIMWVNAPTVGFCYGFIFFAFLMLRYHLHVNDQSHLMKTLSHHNLAHLLQTPMTSRDYFLHHFLLFCRRYGVLIAITALIAFVIGYPILIGAIWWADPLNYGPIVFFLSLTLLIWIAGALQYVIEWRLFAGTFQPVRRKIFSVLLSFALALVCLYVARRGMYWHPAVALFLWLPFSFSCGAGLTLFLGNLTYRHALARLHRRFHGSDTRKKLTLSLRRTWAGKV